MQAKNSSQAVGGGAFVPPAGFVTKQGACEILGCSQSTLSRLLASGALKPERCGWRLRPLVFRQSDVEALAAKGGAS